MRSFLSLFLICTISSLISGCGSGGGDNSSSPAVSSSAPLTTDASMGPCKTRSAAAQNWSTYLCYEYKVNSCDTGKHEFNSDSSYCSGLLDDALNNNCAHEQRITTYQHQCT